MKKKIKAISVKTLPNGYELTFDGQKSSTGYFYFSTEELLEGFMLHIGLGMTESLKREEMDDFTKAVMHWNENSVCVKEIIRLTKEVQAITKKRNALAAQLISERNRYIELTTEAAKLTPIVANIQRYHRKPLTLKELGLSSNDIIDTDIDEENPQNKKNMELEGKITMVMPSRSGTSQRTGNAWMSQEYLMDYYWWPNQTIASRMLIKVFGKDRIEQYNLQEGDEVKIRFHVEANEYNGRWYNDTRVDGVTFVGASESKNHPQTAQGDATASQSATVAQPTTTKEKEPQKPQDADDDLPF